MKFIVVLLFLTLIPVSLFCQDIELGGTDLNGKDILVWNTPDISIPSVTRDMLIIDSVTIGSNFENEGFYGEVSRILKAGGFDVEA
ncbi:MAG: hypothetical protein ABI778_12880, partial [Ignavibacteriota bacterium]